jgi:hypothetical protein
MRTYSAMMLDLSRRSLAQASLRRRRITQNYAKENYFSYRDDHGRRHGQVVQCGTRDTVPTGSWKLLHADRRGTVFLIGDV